MQKQIYKLANKNLPSPIWGKLELFCLNWRGLNKNKARIVIKKKSIVSIAIE